LSFFAKARECSDQPPAPWLGIDMDWPLKKQTLGTVVTYNCPYMTKTNEEELAGTSLGGISIMMSHVLCLPRHTLESYITIDFIFSRIQKASQNYS
jgi:hypothetical protein